MSRRFHEKAEIAGAFGKHRRKVAPIAETVPEPNGTLIDGPVDNGVAYERLGPDFVEVYVEIAEMRRAAMWTAPSPFMILLLKELILKLIEASGTDGTWFLANLGIEDVSELAAMNDLHADSVIEMLDAAVLSIPAELLISMGYENGSAMRGRAHANRRTGAFRRGE